MYLHMEMYMYMYMYVHAQIDQHVGVNVGLGVKTHRCTAHSSTGTQECKHAARHSTQDMGRAKPHTAQ